VRVSNRYVARPRLARRVNQLPHARLAAEESDDLLDHDTLAFHRATSFAGRSYYAVGRDRLIRFASRRLTFAFC
jgi:hypothetical protein